MRTVKALTRVLIAAVALGAAPLSVQAAEPSAGLEEITVTARKFSERLQETPVAVSAFSAEALEQRSVSASTDVVAAVPNVNFGAGYSGSNDAFFFIRGIGVNDWTAAIDPPVGLYLDGVFLGRTAGALFDLVDTDRIEVLRGPQGTLFGRNASGGAISITSRQPTGKFGGDVSVSAGQRDLRSARAAIDVPLGESVSARLSLMKKQQDGWVKRLFDGATLGDVDTDAVRLALRWAASEQLSVLLAADYSRSRNSPMPQVLRDAVPNSASPCPPFCIPFPADLASFALPGNDTSWSLAPLTNDLKAYGTSLTVEWTGSPIGIKSITAYRKIDQDHWADYDGTPYAFYDNHGPTKQVQISQEFQFSGQAMGDRVRWVAGLFYYREKIDQTNAIALGTTGPGGVLFAPVLVPLFPGGPVIFPVAPLVVDPPTPGDLRYRIVSQQRILPETRAYAVFGQADIKLTDRLNLTLGLRFSRDRKQQAYDFFTDNTIPNHPLFPLGLTPSINTQVKESWQSTDPRIGFDYRVTPDVTTYVSYSTGFRAGGFNSRPVVLPITTFNPEKVRSLEAGFKSEWLDRTLRLNAAAFTTRYRDMQIPVLAGGFFSIENAGDARISGAELEFSARPTSAFAIDASVGFLDAQFTKLTQDAITAGVRKDNDLPMSPRWTAAVGAQYQFPLGSIGALTARADYAYLTKRRTYANDAPGNTLDARGLLNARLTWTSPDAAWTAAAIGRNVTDKRYLNWAEDVRSTASPLGVWDVYPAPPREWAVEVAYRF